MATPAPFQLERPMTVSDLGFFVYGLRLLQHLQTHQLFTVHINDADSSMLLSLLFDSKKMIPPDPRSSICTKMAGPHTWYLR